MYLILKAGQSISFIHSVNYAGFISRDHFTYNPISITIGGYNHLDEVREKMTLNATEGSCITIRISDDEALLRSQKIGIIK